MKARNVAGMTPLHWASAWEKREAFDELVKAGADRHVKDKSGAAADRKRLCIPFGTAVPAGAA